MHHPRDDRPRYGEADIGAGQVHHQHLQSPLAQQALDIFNIIEKIVAPLAVKIGISLRRLMGVGLQKTFPAERGFLEFEAVRIPVRHGPGLAQFRYGPLQRDAGVTMTTQPVGFETKLVIAVEKIGGKDGDANVCCQIKHFQQHALLVHGGVHGGYKRRLEVAQVQGGFAQLVIPPHRHGVTLHQFEKTLHDRLFEAVAGGHTVAATTADVAAALPGIAVIGEGAGDQPPAVLCQRPDRRPVDCTRHIIRIRHIGGAALFTPGLAVPVLPLTEAHQVIRMNGHAVQLRKRGAETRFITLVL